MFETFFNHDTPKKGSSLDTCIKFVGLLMIPLKRKLFLLKINVCAHENRGISLILKISRFCNKEKKKTKVGKKANFETPP